jgi:hypothetical protein
MKARERRYSRYKSADVWATLYEQQHALRITVVHGTVQGNTVSLIHEGITYKAVILARSSEWYKYSLNCQAVWKHGITLVVAGTHDSCLPVPVQAIDHPKWYEPGKTRIKSDDLTVKSTDEQGYPSDAFDKIRRTTYGHNIFLGALMCGREDAIQRLAAMREGTVLRIKAELKRLHKRRRGEPLDVGEEESQ